MSQDLSYDESAIQDLSAKFTSGELNLGDLYGSIHTRYTNRGVSRSSVTRSLKSLSKSTKRCCSNKISTCNVGNSGLVIDRSGCYKFCGDIEFNPTVDDSVAITINVDNVTIDMCCHRLSQGNVLSARGFVILPGHKNVTIKNGTVEGFGNSGIDFSTTDESGNEISNLLFEDLLIQENNLLESANGFGVGSVVSTTMDDGKFPVSNVVYVRCRVLQNHVTGLSHNVDPLTFTGKHKGVTIKCSYVDDTTKGVTGPVEGGLITSCQDVLIQDSTFNRTTSTADAETTLSGLSLNDSRSVLVQNSQFCGTKSGSGATTVSGLSAAGLRNAVFEHCQFNNTDGSLTGRIINGFLSNPFADQPYSDSGIKLLHSQMNHNTGSVFGPTNGAVFLGKAKEENIIVDSCEFIGNNVNGNLGFGFGFNQARGLFLCEFGGGTIRNTVMSNNVSNGADPCFGFRQISDGSSAESFTVKNTIIDTCVVSGNTSGGKVYGISFAKDQDVFFPLGVELNDLKDISIKDTRVSNNTGATGSAGIRLFGVSHPIVCDNSVSDNTNGILVTGTNTANADGNVPGFTKEGVFQRNKVDNNVVDGVLDDHPVEPKSAYLDNVAFNNGDNYTPDDIGTNTGANFIRNEDLVL